jgi:integral membrane protein
MLTIPDRQSRRRSPLIARAFRIIAIVEAASWLGLLVGMFFKYGPTGNVIGVEVFGPIHGTVFIAYLAIALLCIRPLRWGPWTSIAALAASVPPFATLLFEWWAERTGRLSRPEANGH